MYDQKLISIQILSIALLTDNNFSVSIKVGSNISIGQFRATYYKFGILEGII